MGTSLCVSGSALKEGEREERKEKGEEMKEELILSKNVSKPKNIRQRNCLMMILKKKMSDELFVRKFRILAVFQLFT